MLDNKVLYKILTLIIGLIFLLSGIGKTIEIVHFEHNIRAYSFFSEDWMISLTAVIICFLETIIGFELLLLYKTKRNIIAVLLLTIGFTLVYTYATIFNNISNCGCFGLFSFTLIESSTALFIKNILIITSVVLILKNMTKDDVATPNNAVVIKVFTIIIAFLLGVFTNLTLKPTQPFENNFNSNELVSSLSLSSDSTYFVFVFSYSCTHCVNSVENVKEYAKANYIDKVIFLTYPSDSIDKSNFNNQFNLDNKIVELPFEKISLFTTRFPIGYYIKHSKLTSTIKGLMPSEMLLKSKLISN